ncbi:MAG: NYN domain-containing protein [Clostridia bacterium]|nr:NYN domain-containing protein [Clostridia bacterium]
MTKLALGILAHVDAGKTTLCEGLMYLTGRIRERGRVDHGDSHLDNHALERKRGITIFSKQAGIKTERLEAELIDTPGHVDFSTEAERVLGILDYAVLIISGTDGVQAHTLTLWKLLRRFHVPTFIFINKMDIAHFKRAELMRALERELSPVCVDFSAEEGALFEAAAIADEALFEAYQLNGALSKAEIAEAIREERIFPCFFGSALHLTGVKEFIEGLEEYTLAHSFGAEFGARVFKISRDAQGQRLTHLRVTGGEMTVRMSVSYTSRSGERKAEKAVGIRLYSCAKFTQIEKASAGEIVAVTGLTETYPGLGLGVEEKNPSLAAVLTPVLSYRIKLPLGVDAQSAFKKLSELSEEDPALSIEWDDEQKQIRARLMGEVQIEVLKSIIKERFDLDAEIDEGRVMYQETIKAPVEGIGHFEPLRHYAEVHLLLSPLEAGSGLEWGSSVSQNDLDLNWQRLILTHIAEKTHRGVLTGSPITDMRIELIAGRAHLAHTEGGDFRQATYRAIRQGLMKAESVLLEPYYAYRIELSREQLGRAIGDIRAMGGSFNIAEEEASDGFAAITGFVPVAGMRGYARTLASYTGGRGRLSLEVSHYDRCTESEKVIAEFAYEPERDIDNTADSVFCAHGAGFTVNWREVENYMHIDTGLSRERISEGAETPEPRLVSRNLNVDEKELEAIMLREFGPIKRPDYGRSEKRAEKSEKEIPPRPIQKEYLMVDGYNMLFAWESLRELAKDDLAAARKRLMDILVNYCGFKKSEIVLVFDGYRVKGNAGERFDYHGLKVAYTKENETADALIERLIAEIGKNYAVRIASSDGMIQLSGVRSGALRMTARELEAEVESVNERLHEYMENLKKGNALVKLELGKAFAKEGKSEMILHKMNLNDRPFEMIKSGQKTIELRLYDEKRRLISVGDIIEFTHSSDETRILRTRVKALHIFKDFAELYAALPLDKCGYTAEDIALASPEDMLEYYSREKQAQYGAVGIELEVLDKHETS